MTKHVLPYEPSNAEEMLIPVRDSVNLLETIVRQTGDIQAVQVLPGAPSDDVSRKVNELVRCLNKLVDTIAGK